MDGGPQAKQIPCPQERHSKGLVLSSPAPAAVCTQQAEHVTEGTREEAGLQSGSFLSLLSQEVQGGAHRHIKGLSKGSWGWTGWCAGGWQSSCSGDGARADPQTLCAHVRVCVCMCWNSVESLTHIDTHVHSTHTPSIVPTPESSSLHN